MASLHRRPSAVCYSAMGVLHNCELIVGVGVRRANDRRLSAAVLGPKPYQSIVSTPVRFVGISIT